MPISPDQLQTGGALQGAVAASLLAQHEAKSVLMPGARIGLYRVIRELGRGGMAVVYLAERDDGEYQQQVALKWMQLLRSDERGEALFRRERQALADLRHPHIARLLDGGSSDDGRPWFAMEYISGDPLDRHCVARKLSQTQRLQLFLQVCSAVAFAHARGVIHRDIKPSNVLVDQDGSAKLLDFGIAALIDQHDGLGDQAYTPAFASPEQRQGQAITVASDIYQLGRLLGCVLANDASVHEPMTRNVLAAAEDTTREGGRFESPATVRPNGLSRDLRAIIAKASAAETSSRYPSAEALIADVRAVLERRPVQARSAGVAYRVKRWVQRHPLAAMTLTTSVILLVSMATAFTWRLRSERDSARFERDRAERALATTEAINRFVNDDILEAANPLRRAPGAPEVTVRQALDLAEQRVDARLAQFPRERATLLTTLAELRYEFGDDDQALALIDRAVAAAGGDPESQTAAIRAAGLRGSLLITTQRFDEAEAALADVVNAAAQRYGANDMRAMEWELRLLEARSQQGADPAHVDDLRALRQRMVAVAGTGTVYAGEAALIAAQSLIFAGQADRADADAQAAVDSLRAAVGEDHPSTLKAMIALGHVYRAEQQGDRAVDVMRRAFELQVARYGADALDSLYMQNELAFTLAALRRYPEAESLFLDLVERRAKDPSVPAPLLAHSLSNLGLTHWRSGQAEKAVADFKRARDALQGVDNVPPQIAASVQRGLGEALLDLGKIDAAEAALVAAESAASSLTPTDWRRLANEGLRVRLLLARGQRDVGAQRLAQLLITMRAELTPDHPVLQDLMRVEASAR